MEYEVHVIDGLELSDPQTPAADNPLDACVGALERELLDALALLAALEQTRDGES